MFMILATVWKFLRPPLEAMSAPIAKGSVASNIVSFLVVRGWVGRCSVHNWRCILLGFWLRALPHLISMRIPRNVPLSRFRYIRKLTSVIIVIPKPAWADRRTRCDIIRKQRKITRLVNIINRTYGLRCNIGTGGPIAYLPCPAKGPSICQFLIK